MFRLLLGFLKTMFGQLLGTVLLSDLGVASLFFNWTLVFLLCFTTARLCLTYRKLYAQQPRVLNAAASASLLLVPFALPSWLIAPFDRRPFEPTPVEASKLVPAGQRDASLTTWRDAPADRQRNAPDLGRNARAKVRPARSLNSKK